MTPTIKEILFPSDLSPQSDHALEHARSLARRFGAALTLYHAVPVPDHRFAHWAFAHGHEIWVQAEVEARSALARRAACVEVPHTVVVERAASVHHAVVQLIRKMQPDLTVMATHGRDGLSRLLLGSVTEQVVQQVFRPVLCIREGEGGGAAFPYKRILVPTDLSLASRLAFPLAAFLARSFEAEVVAIHVVPGTAPAGLPEPRAVVIPSEASLWKFFQTDFEATPVTAQVHAGSVWERILHVATVEKVDLIVMSTRGHDSLADRVMGSNTERVLRRAPCPVLVA